MPSRRGRGSTGSGGFAGAGLGLTLALLGATWQQYWSVAFVVGAVLVAYLLLLHPTNCRVQKHDGDPCTQSARGWLGTCRRHRTMKSTWPTVSRTPGHLWPQLWWPRPGGVAAAYVPADQPHRPRTTRVPAPGPGTRIATVAAVLGVVVAIMSFVRDLIAG